MKCNNCDLVYTNPIFDEEHYLEIYKATEYQEVVKDLGEKSHEYRVKRFRRERVKAIERYLINKNSDVSLLDVGCSTGFFC